jgi:hypothetical protein
VTENNLCHEQVLDVWLAVLPSLPRYFVGLTQRHRGGKTETLIWNVSCFQYRSSRDQEAEMCDAVRYLCHSVILALHVNGIM